jgi:hypothetical protein
MQWAAPCVFTASVWTLVSRERSKLFQAGQPECLGWPERWGGSRSVIPVRELPDPGSQMTRVEMTPAVRGVGAHCGKMLARIHIVSWSGSTLEPRKPADLRGVKAPFDCHHSLSGASQPFPSGLNAARPAVKYCARACISLNESPLLSSSLSPKHEHSGAGVFFPDCEGLEKVSGRPDSRAKRRNAGQRIAKFI